MKPNYTSHQLANFLNISRIVTIHYDEFPTNFHFKGEKHNFWKMVYVDKGQVHISADSKEFDLKQGHIAFHKPNEFHTLSTDEHHSADIFVVSFFSSSSAMEFFKNKTIQLPENLKKKMFSLFQEGFETFEYRYELKVKDTAPVGGQQMFRIHFEELLIMLIRQENKNENKTFFPTKERMENHMVKQLMNQIDDNVYKRITVNDICDTMNYSHGYLAKIFKANVSMSISEYITFAKIKEAKKPIRQGEFTFAQISDMLQFDNQHYFSRVFKKVTNFTPSQYKNSVL